MKNRNLLYRFLLGIKKGLFTPTIPNHISLLNQKPIIRLFRILGGISTLLILSHRLEHLGDGLLYFPLYLFLLYFSIGLSIYISFIAYHRIIHISKILKSGELDIRNSLPSGAR